jgi:hypothetical protein
LKDQLGGFEGVASIPAAIFDEKLKWIRRGEGTDFGVSYQLSTLPVRKGQKRKSLGFSNHVNITSRKIVKCV